MKPQDLAFIVVFAVLLYLRNPRYLVIAGLFCIAIAMPLFAKWIFFTAERLTWYAAACFLAAIGIFIYENRHRH